VNDGYEGGWLMTVAVTYTTVTTVTMAGGWLLMTVAVTAVATTMAASRMRGIER
jgi:hypothetical protein